MRLPRFAGPTVVLTVVALIGFALSHASGEAGFEATHPELPAFGQLARFSAEDEKGAPFHANQLRGAVYILHFTRTRGLETHPLTESPVLHQLFRLLERLPHNADTPTVVSLDVDPSSSATLLPAPQIAKGFWRVLRRGDTSHVLEQTLSMLEVADGGAAVSEERINALIQEGVVALVDQSGWVRGFYALRDLSSRSFGELLDTFQCLRECGPTPSPTRATFCQWPVNNLAPL